MAALLDLRPADGAVGAANIIAALKRDSTATLTRQQAAPPVRDADGRPPCHREIELPPSIPIPPD